MNHLTNTMESPDKQNRKESSEKWKMIEWNHLKMEQDRMEQDRMELPDKRNMIEWHYLTKVI